MQRTLDRRQALAVMGTVSLGGILAACGSGDGESDVTTTDGTTTSVQSKTESGVTAELFDESASCSLTPEETEGPYYFDVDRIRSDIREDRDGTLLRLAIRVRDAESCMPIENAVVDVWHCDALGGYSGTEDTTYLRGAQVTNADGVVEFKTIFPGWYQGRTVHIHAKVHTDNQTVLTTQLYFDEDVNSAVYSREPYAQHTGRDVFNDDDGIFDERLVTTTRKDGSGYLSIVTFDVAA